MSETLCETFRVRLIRIRKGKSLSQQETGELAKMYPSQISSLESGKRHPMAETIFRLAVALDCSSDYLLGLSNNPARVGISQEAYDEIVKENHILRTVAAKANLQEILAKHEDNRS